MNARAACRLATLGFEEVYRYAPGKADWRAAGLPTERAAPAAPQAGDALRRDVPSCSLEATVQVARQRAEAIGVSYCLVVTGSDVVVGRLRGDDLDEPSHRPVVDVMEVGPTTIRADDPLDDLVQRMGDAGVATIVVTDPDGRLLGVLHRDDAEKLLRGPR